MAVNWGRASLKVSGSLTLGGRTDDKNINKFISYGILAVIVFYVLQLIMPFLLIGIVGLVIYQFVFKKKF
jgi:hypothetical protein